MKIATNIFLLLLFHSAAGVNAANIFHTPPAKADRNPEYKNGEQIQVRWNTSMKRYSLVLWQVGTGKGDFIRTNMREATSHNWTVMPTGNLSRTSEFVLQLIDDNNENNYFVCHNFNIINKNNKAAPTTTTIATASSTSSTTTSASTASPTSSPTHPSSSSSQTKLGIGLGVGLGGAFLLALGVILLYFRRLTAAVIARSNAPTMVPIWLPTDNTQPPSEPETKPQKPQHGRPPVEVPGDYAAVAPGDRVRHELPS